MRRAPNSSAAWRISCSTCCLGTEESTRVMFRLELAAPEASIDRSMWPNDLQSAFEGWATRFACGTGTPRGNRLGGNLMIGILIIAHGNLAGELLAAARKITSETEKLVAVDFEENENPDTSRRRIQEALDQVQAE